MKALLLCVLLLAFRANAATINAASPDRDDVNTAVQAAARDDIVAIPAGTGTGWSGTYVDVTNGITIQGAGMHSTILDLTGNSVPFQINFLGVHSGITNRITGIQFRGGVNAIASWGADTDYRIRIDHCLFTNMSSWAIQINNSLGVVDHNVCYGNHPAWFAYVFHGNFNGGSGLGYGDGSWAEDNLFGTDRFMFFEDNLLTNNLPGFHLTTVDGFRGCRYVFRNNDLFGGSLEFHGTESGGRNRGGRAVEVYNNDFWGTAIAGYATYYRSGVGVIWSNVLHDWNTREALGLLSDRNDSAFPPFSTGNAEWAGSDGQNPWDVNVAGGPFATGTATAHTAGSQVSSVSVSGSPYTINQWTGYSITKTSGKTISALTRSGSTVTVTCTAHGFTGGEALCIRGANQPQYNTATISGTTVLDADHFTYPLDFGAGTPTTPATGTMYCFEGYYFSEIVSNSVSTIYYKSATQGPGFFLRFTNSPADTFSLWKVDHAIDQPGRCCGSEVAATDTPSRPSGWNDQTTSPWYQWDNEWDGQTLLFNVSHKTIRSGEHYFDNTAAPGYVPFDYPHYLVDGTGGGGGAGTPAIVGPGLPFNP